MLLVRFRYVTKGWCLVYGSIPFSVGTVVNKSYHIFIFKTQQNLQTMKKVYLVSHLITVRVIADSEEEAQEKAITKAIEQAAEIITEESYQCTDDDIETPVDYDDIEHCLYPDLAELSKEQKAIAAEAWEIHQREVAAAQKEEGGLFETLGSALRPEPNKLPSWLTPDILEAADNMEKAGSIWDQNMEDKNLLQPETNVTLTFSPEGNTASVSPDILDIDYIKANPGKIFATGVTNNPAIYDQPVRWIAKIGGGDDWAIYYHLYSRDDIQWVAQHGEKLIGAESIRGLVTCTDEAFQRYRY